MEGAPEWILVGYIASPHGIGGEVNVKVLTDRPERFDTGARLFLKVTESGDYRNIRVAVGRLTAQGAIVQLEGIGSREQAEELAGASLYISREQLLPPKDGYYYGFQLEGCEVYEGVRLLGTVRQLAEGKANPYLEIEPAGGGSDILVPFVGAVILKVDLQQRRIEIPEGFLG